MFVRLLAMVTAGFANDVEEVHQYAAVINKDTANGLVSTFFWPDSPITEINPNVAMISEMKNRKSLRSWIES